VTEVTKTRSTEERSPEKDEDIERQEWVENRVKSVTPERTVCR
jgi:hypothetical protein